MSKMMTDESRKLGRAVALLIGCGKPAQSARELVPELRKAIQAGDMKAVNSILARLDSGDLPRDECRSSS